MKYLILVLLIMILSVSCASSRQELSVQRSVSTLEMETETDYMEELLSRLEARFSDSVYAVVENYYPPKSDSDSVGPLKSKVTYHRKSDGDVAKNERKDVRAKGSETVHANDSTNNEKQLDIQKGKAPFRLNIFHLFFLCILFMFVYYRWSK